MKNKAWWLGLPLAPVNWYQNSFKNKVLVSVLTIFVCIYGGTLQLVYMQTASNLLSATQKEVLSTTGTLAMALYRSYEVENDQREIQSFVVGSKLYRDNVINLHVLNRQLQVIASTNEDAILSTLQGQPLTMALENQFSLKLNLDETPPNIKVAYPISAGLADKTNGKYFAVGVIENTIDISEQLEALANIRLLTIAAGLVILVALALALSRISSALTRPIEHLFQAMLKVDKDNLEVKVPISSHDEIGFLGSTFNKMIQSLKQSRMKLESMIESTTRFVPSEFLEMLGKNNITDVALGDAKFTTITVLFMDIRDFTGISNNMSAQDVLKLLNSLNQYILPAIEKHQGFIDKYIGDAVMAIFPHQPDHALFAALDMLKGLELFNKALQQEALPTINFGIGINTGDAIVGTVGNAQRMDTTVIGDTVNIASRLEGLTKRLNTPIIFSQNVFNQLQEKNKDKLKSQSLGQVKVRGVEKSVDVFGLLL